MDDIGVLALKVKLNLAGKRIHLSFVIEKVKEKQLPSDSTILPSRFASFISKLMQGEKADYPSIIFQ